MIAFFLGVLFNLIPWLIFLKMVLEISSIVHNAQLQFPKEILFALSKIWTKILLIFLDIFFSLNSSDVYGLHL